MEKRVHLSAADSGAHPNPEIACTYDNGNTVDIPWEWKDNGAIDIDIVGAVEL